MDALGDINVLIPAEHFEAFSKVISAGIQRAKISPSSRNELSAWWEAEQGMIAEEINSKSKPVC